MISKLRNHGMYLAILKSEVTMFPHPTIIGMGRPVDVPMLMGRPIDVQMLMGRPIDVPMFMGRPINVPMFMGRPIDVSMFVLPLKCFMYPFDS